MFAKILVATDRPFDVDPAVVTAARLAHNISASLNILHVMPKTFPEQSSDFEQGNLPAAELELYAGNKKDIQQSMERLYAPLPAGIRRTIQAVQGEPWQEILTRARALKATLIVMGPHGGSMQKKAGRERKTGSVGSTVEAVLRRERCPVMIVSSSMAAHSMVFRRLLVAVDFSKSCECAVCFSARVARHFQTEVVIFHMIPVLPFPKYSQLQYQRDVVLAQQRIEGFCEEYLSNVVHQYLVWGGALPHLEIVRCAELNQADAIVMGSHTKEKEGKWYAGSAVERVASLSRNPVMVITDPAVLTPWKWGRRSPKSGTGRAGGLIRVQMGA